MLPEDNFIPYMRWKQSYQANKAICIKNKVMLGCFCISHKCMHPTYLENGQVLWDCSTLVFKNVEAQIKTMYQCLKIGARSRKQP